MTLNLDKNTYGKTPAALYLTLYLNEKGDEALNRKVGRKLEAWRSAVKDVVMCHLHTDEMAPSTFNRLINMFDTSIRESVTVLPDKLCQELVTNILIGEIKSWKTRAAVTSRLQQKVNRKVARGEIVPVLRVMPRAGEETDDERVLRLKERSRRYLERHGKQNTLY